MNYNQLRLQEIEAEMRDIDAEIRYHEEVTKDLRDYLEEIKREHTSLTEQEMERHNEHRY